MISLTPKVPAAASQYILVLVFSNSSVPYSGELTLTALL
jgi:hypothetical protein